MLKRVVKSLLERLQDKRKRQSGVQKNPAAELIKAAAEGTSNKVRAHLEGGVDVNATNWNKQTALMRATSGGHIKTVELLLSFGADVNAIDENDFNALIEAASGIGSDRVEIIKALVAAGIDVNQGAPFVLNHAMDGSFGQRGDPAVVGALIDGGINVNIPGPWGTALHHAAYLNRPEFVEMLLEAGADTTIRAPATENGPLMTPLELAIEKKAKKVIPLLQAAAEGKKLPANDVKFQRKKTSQDQSVPATWQRLSAWLKEHIPQVKLGEKASDEELRTLEKKIGVSLPEDFKVSYLIHNGAAGSFIPYEPETGIGCEFFSLDEVLSEWQMHKRLLKGGDWADLTGSGSKGVRDVWWNTRWIPFAGPRNGDCLCLDLDPDEGGIAGQVIWFNHESSRRERIAASFAEWLAKTAEEIESLAD